MLITKVQSFAHVKGTAMAKLSFNDRIEYYKLRIKFLQEENEKLINQNLDYLKTIDTQSLRIRVLENRLKEYINDRFPGRPN
jgi:hypothetical protein